MTGGLSKWGPMADGAHMTAATRARDDGNERKRIRVSCMPLACAGVVIPATAALAAAEDVGGWPLRPFTERKVFLEPAAWGVILTVVVVLVLVRNILRQAFGGRPEAGRTMEKTGGAGMSAENLTIQEVSEARVEAILAELKKAGNSGRGSLAVLSEFELADVFADRFRSAFMVQNSTAYPDDPKWFHRPAPGIDKPPLAHFAVRHACKRMIFVLAGADPENAQDRVWLERRKTVENVLEVASWDPRVSYREGYVEGAP